MWVPKEPKYYLEEAVQPTSWTTTYSSSEESMKDNTTISIFNMILLLSTLIKTSKLSTTPKSLSKMSKNPSIHTNTSTKSPKTHPKLINSTPSSDPKYKSSSSKPKISALPNYLQSSISKMSALSSWSVVMGKTLFFLTLFLLTFIT